MTICLICKANLNQIAKRSKESPAHCEDCYEEYLRQAIDKPLLKQILDEWAISYYLSGRSIFPKSHLPVLAESLRKRFKDTFSLAYNFGFNSMNPKEFEEWLDKEILGEEGDS